MRKNKRMATFLKFSIMGIRSFDKKISVWELLKVWEHPWIEPNSLDRYLAKIFPCQRKSKHIHHYNT
jgi:hypothetical protein